MSHKEKAKKSKTTNASSDLKRTSEILSVRRIKTYSFHRISRSTDMYNRKPKVVPLIRLCGNWLQGAGFIVDKDLTITVMKDMIVIKPTKEI
ncbi:SymE family type I addiction module toxin [Flavobacterium branchiicola]|uniref:SymE family type I addiction module toxin n=1 Tax=Flavobacterium branchiicola TaxID=1114875 RepID=A0ABV9PI77_9FLAO|nr:SymE family type I addiction module toxin [Flavobacterium branchiicola]MBS7255045.1 SymE family type I addiction module toxin [Flavobacterium branchiicola]